MGKRREEEGKGGNRRYGRRKRRRKVRDVEGREERQTETEKK